MESLSLSDIGGNLMFDNMAVCYGLLKVFKLQIVMFYAIIFLPLRMKRHTLRFH